MGQGDWTKVISGASVSPYLAGAIVAAVGMAIVANLLGPRVSARWLQNLVYAGYTALLGIGYPVLLLRSNLGFADICIINGVSFLLLGALFPILFITIMKQPSGAPPNYVEESERRANVWALLAIILAAFFGVAGSIALAAENRDRDANASKFQSAFDDLKKMVQDQGNVLTETAKRHEELSAKIDSLSSAHASLSKIVQDQRGAAGKLEQEFDDAQKAQAGQLQELSKQIQSLCRAVFKGNAAKRRGTTPGGPAAQAAQECS